MLNYIKNFIIKIWHHFDSYTPLSQMTKSDLENIIIKIYKKEDLSSNNQIEKDIIENERLRKEYLTAKKIAILVFFMVSVFGAIGPGKEFVNDFLEKKKNK